MSASMLPLFLLLGPLGSPEPISPPEDWACEYCPEPAGWFGSFGLGGAHVSDDSFKFADYTGRDEGAYLVASGDGAYISSTSYWRFSVADLGLDSRSIAVDGGRSGTWRLSFIYDEIPKRLNDTGRTPFAGAGTGSITLPDNWVAGFTTADMAVLDASLRPLSLGFDRTRIGLGLDWTPSGNWNYGVDYSRQTKEGTRAVGAGFMFTSALLPAPVDYVTDELEATAQYAHGDWIASVSYYGSFFDNQDGALRWDNPFFPVNFGAEAGQMALAPDNEFHRVSASFQHRPTDWLKISSALGVGRMDQDDTFLPYTINTEIFPPLPLPRQSLNGEVDVVNASLGVDIRLTDKASIDVDYRFYDRDNNTEIEAFTPVSQDIFLNPPTLNRAFSYEREDVKLTGTWRPTRALRLEAGVRQRDTERNRETPSDTDERDYWFQLQTHVNAVLSASLRYTDSDRDGELIDPEAELATRDNPALRKFIYADRERDELRALVTFAPHERVQFTFTATQADEDYENSQLGLTRSESEVSSFDIAFLPTANWTLHAFTSREDIDSTIVNQENGANWFATNRDEFRTMGAGSDWRNIADKGVDVSIDFIDAESEGEYLVGPSALPVLTTELTGWRLRLRWPIKDNSDIVFDYYREELTSVDWQLDGVNPDSIFNQLTLGEFSPDYDIDTFALWYRMGFD